MADKIPNLNPEEVDNVFNLILDRARNQGRREVFIEHEDLAPLLTGDTDWSNSVSKLDTVANKKDIARRNNRVKTKMVRKLAEKGIVDIKFHENGYNFIIDKDIKIESIVNTVSESTFEEHKAIETFTNYDTPFHPPHHFPDLLMSIRRGLSPLQVGPKGCGKSRSFEEAAAILGLPHIRIALGQVHDPADLIGTKEIVEENGVPVTKFQPGLITEALKKGWMVILDELDSVQAQVALALNMVLENKSRIACMTERGIEYVDRHPNARIVASANTWGFGDASGLYAGTEIQNRATWDRFSPYFENDYDPIIEEEIIKPYLHANVIKALYCPQDTPQNKAGVIVKIREAIAKKEIHDQLSIRAIERFAMHYKDFGWHKGLMYFIVNQFNPMFRESVCQIIRVQMGNEFTPSINDYNSKEANYIPDMVAKIKLLGQKGEGFVIE